jgi:hypothetical protein
MNESTSKFEPLTAAGLDGVEIAFVLATMAGDEEEDFYGTSAYEKLYTYFLDENLMPYGIAKARDGMPDDWILEYLEELA